MKTAILALLLFSASVSAQPYVVGTMSSAQIDANVGDGISKSTTAFSLGAGYRFSKYFGAEASYLQTGKIHGEDADRVQGVRTFTTSHFFDAKGFSLSALGSFPVSGSVSLLGKLGADRLTLTHSSQTLETAIDPVTRKSFFVDVQAHPRTTEEVWVPSIGIGAAFTPWANVQFRAMLQQVKGRGTLDSIRMLSLSAAYSF